MRVLVCGGRAFDDEWLLNRTLDELHAVEPFEVVIHGTATGADSLADAWAKRNKIDVLRYPADWKRYGNSAGPIRNQQMIDEGHPDIAIAFKGGRGTRDMIEKCRQARLPLMVFGEDGIDPAPVRDWIRARKRQAAKQNLRFPDDPWGA